jgi:hypothetical protein
MKALSVRQPFAWCIVAGTKPIENRTWNTTYRGPLLIHAAVKPHLMTIAEVEHTWGAVIDRGALRYGGIIGRVELVDVVREHASPWFQGPFGFVLQSPRAVEFLPMTGKQGLFDAPDIG